MDLVDKVYEFGGGQVREHLGGIYDFLHKKDIESLDELHLAQSEAAPSKPSAEEPAAKSAGKLSYEQQKERAKIIRKAERAVAEKEQLVTRLEQQKADIEALLATPENGNNADLFAQYAEVQKQLATAEEEWMMAEEELAALSE